MRLSSKSFEDGGPIPEDCAFAVIGSHHVSVSANRNPNLKWDEPPVGSKSFALICRDYDVPSRGADVNQEDREIPESLPRVDFFHWLLFDIPAATREIFAGSHSDGVTPRGKLGPAAPGSAKHGINDYTQLFSHDAAMRGEYFGYDGPAPPWNDSVTHHYVFTLYALDVAHLDVKEPLTGANLRLAIVGHVLAESSITGTYTLNPRLAAELHGSSVI
jgi:Raf kinase inhibitor-like YbhB/YbcL family protein